MSGFKFEDFRSSSSSIDDFFSDRRPVDVRVATSGKIRIAGTHQLVGFHVVAKDTLVRTSNQDFWRLGQDEDGAFIERLVDDNQGPIKG